MTITSTRSALLTNGTLDLDGKTLNAGLSFVTGAGTKNLTFNGGTLVCPTASTTSFNNLQPTNFTTTAGTGTYGARAGAYIKVGRLTYIAGIVVWTAHTGTGNLRLSGLPFVAGSDGIGMLTYTTLTVTGTPYLEIIDNQSYADVYTRPTAGGSSATVAMDTAATLKFSFCYRASS